MSKLERYLVFAYSTYYPSGGIADAVADEPDLDSAIAIGRSRSEDYVYVWDQHSRECVWDRDQPENPGN